MSEPLQARVEALVADDGYRRLLARLRQRLERGGRPASVLLRGLDRSERRALADLLGRPDLVDPDVRVRLADVDASLRSSRVGAGLVEVLEALGGPLDDQRAARQARDRAWAGLFAELAEGVAGPDEFVEADAAERLAGVAVEGGAAEGAEPQAWRRDWVEGLRRGTLKRLADGVDDARSLMDDALAVLAQLPADGMPLADLAARATGDPHALDHGRGRPLAALVLSAVAVQQGLPPDQPVDARDRRDLWAAVGVECDPLSVTTLVHGFAVEGTSLLATTLRAHAQAGEPVRLTLRQLEGAALTLPGGVIHVCENPTVVAAAAAILGADSGPLLCVEGVPSTATHALLDALGEVEVRVHADFDAGGIRIATLLHRRTGVVPWRFGATDYLTALDTVGRTIPLTAPVDDAPWDPALAAVVNDRGRAVYEEQVLDVLLADLAPGRTCGQIP